MANYRAELTDQLLVVIVLYNTSLSDSDSYQSIVNGFKSFSAPDHRIDLLIVNNGPDSTKCYADESVFQMHFVEQLDNPGVSKAYNLASEFACRLRKQWLLLLDQDTHLPVDFWHQYSQSMHQFNDVPVHAPRLYANDMLISPCGYRYYRGYPLVDLQSGLYPMRGRNVLNSGLLVSVDAFQRAGGYDETVRLYFSDFVFFDKLKELYTTFAVIDIDLQHDLSSSDYSTQSTAMQRFSLYSEGARAATKREIMRSLLYFATVGSRSLIMNYRFKTWVFTRVFLQIWFTK